MNRNIFSNSSAIDKKDLTAALLPKEAESTAAVVVAHVLKDLYQAKTSGKEFSVTPIYHRWVQSSRKYLVKEDILAYNRTGDKYLSEQLGSTKESLEFWNERKTRWAKNADHAAYIELIDACLNNLADILTGDVPATDIVFPESSMRLVEGIYKNNIIADYFNYVLAESLKGGMDAAAKRDHAFRILEIGAGTGGTTALLLPLLKSYDIKLAEYCYTDLSKAFLLHAEEHYQPSLPAIRPTLFDVTKPIAGQDVKKQNYDFAIATNVLHATPNIRETLRNTKAALKKDGFVLINEISQWSWHTHLTFGLLEGWWLYEDEAIRLPGSPGLSPDQWKHVLEQEGYHSVSFPAEHEHGLGQQIILAQSDGVVRQKLQKSARGENEIGTKKNTPVRAQAKVAESGSLKARSIDLFSHMIAEALRIEKAQLEHNKALESYGLDSILVVQLAAKFRKIFPSVRSTLFFEVRDLEGLANYFIENEKQALTDILGEGDNTNSVSVEPASVKSKKTKSKNRASKSFFQDKKKKSKRAPEYNVEQPREQVSVAPAGGVFDVAIVGATGRFPKSANLDQLWENLSKGINCVSEIPSERWQWQEYYDAEKGVPGKMYTRWAGFIEDIDKFDPLFFKISPKEAKNIDPQERLFLETCYHTIEDSGYTPGMLSSTNNVGVFVGVMNSRYTTKPLYYSIANRVSYFFDFSGPSMAVDSACSSSLSAIHIALQSLYSGSCDLAIAGGVNLIIDPQHILELTAVGMLSQGDQCKSFGEGADGFVDAEGVGAFLLKPLQKAVEDNDSIYSVIKGSAVNSGGRTHGYTVPNPLAQAKVVEEALKRANVSPDQVGYIEAHGTGTSLGDPIEIAGLTRAFNSRAASQEQNCSIGSIKSNMGHCESAAGIAGLSKILLQIQHQQLVPSLHARVTNSEIDFEKTPFKLQKELSSWNRVNKNGVEQPLTAGVSSFGAGGANAHIVVQEFMAGSNGLSAKLEEGNAVIIPLSARTEKQLLDKAQGLLNFVQSNVNVSLLNMAYTLQVGRESMEERFALVVSTIAELTNALLELSQGKQSRPNSDQSTHPSIYRGNVKKDRKTVEQFTSQADYKNQLSTWFSSGKLANLAEYWAKGVEVDWAVQYSGEKPKRISLPVYPFARDSYWKKASNANSNVQHSGAVKSLVTVDGIHPLLHKNQSNIHETLYCSTFDRQNPYALCSADSKQPRVPQLALLEMAGAAIQDAHIIDRAKQQVSFEALAWGEECDLNESQQLFIELFPINISLVSFEVRNHQSVVFQGSAVVSDIHLKSQSLERQLDEIRNQAGQSIQKYSANELYQKLQASGYSSSQTYQAIKNISVADGLTLVAYDNPGWLDDDLTRFDIHPGVLESVYQSISFQYLTTNPDLNHSDIYIPSLGRFEYYGKASDKGSIAIHSRLENNHAVLDAYLISDSGHCYAKLKSIEITLLSSAVTTASRSSKPVSSPQPIFSQPIQQKAPQEETNTPAKFVKQEIIVSQSSLVSSLKTEAKMKPQGISLCSLTDYGPGNLGQEASGQIASAKSKKAQINVSLAAPGLNTKAETAECPVRLYQHNLGIYSLELSCSELNAETLAQFQIALESVSAKGDVKALLISGSESEFLHGDRNAIDLLLSSGLHAALSSFPAPIIAAMQGNATGAGFLLAALCDFMVCGEASYYAFTDHSLSVTPDVYETQFFQKRFGKVLANDFLFLSQGGNGASLAEKGWTCTFSGKHQVEESAWSIIKDLVEKPKETLHLLKKQLSRVTASEIQNLGNTTEAFEKIKTIQLNELERHSDKSIDSYGSVTVSRLENSIVSIQLTSPENLFEQLTQTLLQLASQESCQGIVVSSTLNSVFPQSKKLELDHYINAVRCLLHIDIPVVFALDGNVSGLIWLLALAADNVVYAVEGQYGTQELWQLDAPMLSIASAIFESRFTHKNLKAQIYGGITLTGEELQKAQPYSHVVESNSLIQTATSVTDALASENEMPVNIWKSWKAQRNIDFESILEFGDLTLQKKEQKPSLSTELAQVLPLTSEVIQAKANKLGVVLVEMIERKAKNMFSDDFIAGIEEVFGLIENATQYKVVVLTGYENYFACGGTKESLVAIQEGKAKFTDAKIYQLPMSCKLPVIAAMQGHTIGGGWTLGMFSDICLFSEESHFISPYTRYGFTPGAGSTLIFPATLGCDLAKESLFTAREYTGKLLAEKGLNHQTLPRTFAVSRALDIANQIALHDREKLIALKESRVKGLLSKVEETYQQELEMHDKSFVGRETALKDINANFLSEDETEVTHVVVENLIEKENAHNSAAISIGEVEASLRQLLANELQIDPEEIDLDTQFIDVGLDSITGVTWVRKINEAYQTKIEATKVYSYPTLKEFSEFIYGLMGSPKISTSVNKPVPISSPQSLAKAENVAEVVAPVSMVKTQASSETYVAEIRIQLKKLLAQELHMSESDLDENAQFVDLGLDSITGVTWVRKINEAYNTKIEATKVYSYPTLTEFADFLFSLPPVKSAFQASIAVEETVSVSNTNSRPLQQSEPVQTARVSGARNTLVSFKNQLAVPKSQKGMRFSDTETIAVIGMAGQFPHANNLDEYWQNIADGKLCIDEVPKQRWNIDAYFNEDYSVPNTTNSRWMGALQEYDLFDPLFFNISPIEAESMDPQQRALMQNCWHAIEDAGYNSKTLSSKNCGVFIGCGATDYHQYSQEHQYSAQGFTGAAMSILAARISYFLDLRGPCLSIDTACSSSLVALANACDSLATGKSDLAFAGGVAIMAGPEMHIKTAQSGMLSPDGKCYTFDQRANGFVPGEGVGIVMLKRMTDAEKDGDTVHAKIVGWGVNQDGKTNGITAPNAVSQSRLMKNVYDKFQISPENIQLIEAHGTATKLGDPIEIEGLKSAFGEYTENTRHCALGSVKTNIGHSLFAAGIAGVLKLVMALKHKQLPPTVNFANLNEHIDLQESPFYVNGKLASWPENTSGSRLAAVSSFGFSGTNAHIVIEQGAVQTEVINRKTSPGNQPVMIPLSAKSVEALTLKCQQLAEYIEKYSNELSLIDLAYTLQLGRDAMSERVGFVVSGFKELVEKLGAFSSGSRGAGIFISEEDKRGSRLAFIQHDIELQNTLVDKCLSDRKLDKLMDLWVDGLDLDWSKLYSNGEKQTHAYKKIRLPLYPFAKERYWLDTNIDRYISSGKPLDTAYLHPLLHVNTSSLVQQSYQSTFTGEEFFLHDHRVRLLNGAVTKVLPGVAYIEMVRAAIDDALPQAIKVGTLKLNNLMWLAPIAVDEEKRISLDLAIDEDNLLTFEIYSEEKNTKSVHFNGEAKYVNAFSESEIEPESVVALKADNWAVADIYKAFAGVGLHYGNAHRGIQTIHQTGRNTITSVELPPCIEESHAEYVLHPSILDSVLQSSIGFYCELSQLPEKGAVPFLLESMLIYKPSPKKAFVCLVHQVAGGQDQKSTKFDAYVYSQTGELCIEIKGFTSRIIEEKPETIAASGHDSHRPIHLENVSNPEFEEDFYMNLLSDIANQSIQIDEAVELG